MDSVVNLCKKAKENSLYIQKLSDKDRNRILEIISSELLLNAEKILEANALDIKAAVKNNMAPHLIDRLALNPARIGGIAKSIEKLLGLPCPVGETVETFTALKGMKVKKVRVPFGVVGIIYEARPNVTIDAVALCIKSGNSVVLRGSKDALDSNTVLVDIVKNGLKKEGFNPEFIQLIKDAARESSVALMSCRKYVDVLIPRGSAGLISTVVENSLVPVIETGTGNCHAYVEGSADFSVAERIILNGKLQRPSVCNALETLLVDRSVADKFLPKMLSQLKKNGVEIRACAETIAIYKDCRAATEEDFYTEFLDLILAVKIVGGYREAIEHINKYGSGHSEVIITKDPDASEAFKSDVDSAAVYVNASTRFTDGYEFGFGAEMGISTQKMHARGPMGLKELTSYKYIIEGSGEVRD